jgi:hypothetical protein
MKMSEQSPITVEAPTVIVSNSNEDLENAGSPEPSNVTPHSDGAQSNIELADGPNDATQSEGVAIAAIEAERDITLAAISSEVERERIELEGERIEALSEEKEELEACRRELAELREAVTKLENLLTPPPQLEVVTETEELPIVPETDLTLPSTVAPTVEQSLENSEENLEERTEEVIPSRVRKFIAI